MVTLADGSRHLIHHGDGYAADGHTPIVIASADSPSSDWQPAGTAYEPNCNVGRMMGNAKAYNVRGNNFDDITASHPNATVRVKSFGGYSTDILPK